MLKRDMRAQATCRAQTSMNGKPINSQNSQLRISQFLVFHYFYSYWCKVKHINHAFILLLKLNVAKRFRLLARGRRQARRTVHTLKMRIVRR
ncbi:hypothetical protein DUNSADRAFT_14252 [Dunaliella salina]|uniref:Encoded protein n=1 Tax=Dunaliella salina TaxID=3046 RepID=A0ABQ7G7P4_DUNSA|nr:hypothetical protein DUNSADRAFT_14252 [Dunaliella salina]|eukprot:KAF5830628.1 hypothetical protein DUNSADRAFT_14252 [Dunaliella salina]